MKRIVFIAILLLILGIGWTIYLEYSNKRFAENLPKALTPISQSISTEKSATTPQNSNDATIVPGAWVPLVDAPTASELNETDPAPSKDAPEITIGEMINWFEEEFAEELAEDTGDAEIKETFQAFLESEEITMEEYEKREIAQETLQRFLKNPENVLAGRPMTVGAVYLTNEDVLEAITVLDPNEKNKDALERFRRFQAQRRVDYSKSKIISVEYNGQRINYGTTADD